MMYEQVLFGIDGYCGSSCNRTIPVPDDIDDVA